MIQACDLPFGYVSDSTDCDDTDTYIYPGAIEYCDGVDNNCDGVTDENTSIDASLFYADTDQDGYGDPDSAIESCLEPQGYVIDDTDCDDMDASIHPTALHQHHTFAPTGSISMEVRPGRSTCKPKVSSP